MKRRAGLFCVVVIAALIVGPAIALANPTTAWIQFTGLSGSLVEGVGLALDDEGNVYFASTNGNKASLKKFGPDGSELWEASVGSWGTEATEVTVGSQGNIYMTGVTFEDLYGPEPDLEEAFLTKFDSDGNELWGRRFEANTRGGAVELDASGNVYVALRESFDLGKLKKLDSAGNEIWNKEMENEFSWVANLSIGPDGSIYVAMRTHIARYNPDGSSAWTTELSSPDGISVYDVAVDGAGNAYVTGSIGVLYGGAGAWIFDGASESTSQG